MKHMQQTIIEFRTGQVVAPTGRGGRFAFSADTIQAKIASGAVESLPWASITASENGEFSGRGLGVLRFMVELPAPQTFLLAASGHSMAYVNGEPRLGDVYSDNRISVPVRLKAGKNEFLFPVGRGRFAGKLVPITTELSINTTELTQPDVVLGESSPLWGSVVVVNASEKTQRGLKLLVNGRATAVPPLPPFSVRKAAFQLVPPRDLTKLTGDELPVTLELGNAKASFSMRVRKPTLTHKRTFISQIDGSVQYYAVNPAQKPARDNALILSLHGASVQAQGQAEAYGAKDGATLAAATNRRPYGFDWEDWGRLDAFEVLADAAKRYPHDPTQRYLTGHSMGGHGTWSVGSLFPGQFAAIGPSAGWISFGTYGGANRPASTSPVTAVFSRAANQYDTLLFKENLKQAAVYVLHGDADDNVPVTEARTMRKELEAISHPKVLWYEEPGAGHWWDNDPKTPGAACVDWPPMNRLFAACRRTENPESVSLVTVNPAVSATNAWATLEQQEVSLDVSSFQLRREGTRLTGTTKNITRLSVTLTGIRDLTLDGQTLTHNGSPLALEKVGGQWKPARKPVPATEKNARRSGPFKQAFTQRFVLVYGTAGTPEENAWSYAKARFDAEQFLYRGNASPDLLPDTEFDTKRERDRSVILYGNADTNRLWKQLLGKCPIQVRRDGIIFGNKSKALRQPDLACLFVYPRPDSALGLIGAIGGTGLPGLRLTERVPYFTSGTPYPDWCVFGPKMLTEGMSGVLEAGFFDNRWGLTT